MTKPIEQGELLPCPFCGGSAVSYEGRCDSFVKCDNGKCGAEGAIADTEAEAITAWNTRSDHTLEE